MSERKILVDLLNLANAEIAGVGTFARNLFRLWLADEVTRHEITFIASRAIDAKRVFDLNYADVKVRYVNVQHVLLRFLYQQLVMPFLMRGYKLYYNPALGLPFLARVIAPRSRLVVTIHDMIPFFFPAKYSATRSLLVKKMSIFSARVADCVITVSENSRKDIINLARVSPDKVRIVYNFVLRQHEVNNCSDGKYFLCISTLEPGKNVEQVIEGFAAFIHQVGNTHKFFWVGRVGWGYSSEYLQKLISKAGLEGKFILTGYVDEERKAELIRNCTVIVYLSHYEGFGLPVLEGMAFNKSALVSDNSSLPEVVGSAGISCDRLDPRAIADGLQSIVANRNRLAEHIPEQLAKFAPAEQIASFKMILKDMLG